MEKKEKMNSINKVIKIVSYIDKKILGNRLKKLYYKGKTNSGDKTFSSQREEFVNDQTIRHQLEKVNPARVLCSGRLDVVVRYLLFRDIVYNNITETHKSLYCKTILSRSGGTENEGFYSENAKSGMTEHINEAQKLADSMKESGFKEEYYIPVAKDYGLYNGAHRLACAIAMKEDVWIRECGNSGYRDMDFQWFCNKGFSNEDKIRILRGFADIHKNCGIFVLYGPSKPQWDYIQKTIIKHLHVVGSVDLDFTRDYIGFEKLIQEIYHDYTNNSVIVEKISLLKMAELKLRIILVSDEKNKADDIYRIMRTVKGKLRELLRYDYAKEAYITLHSTDSYEEFDDLKQIVLSVNNLQSLSMRNGIPSKKFIKWTEDFKQYARKHGISIDDACIVGSSPLEVAGIRESTDIDIVVSPELRIIYGDGISHLTDNLDIVTRNYVRNTGEIKIYDEQLIYDDEYHFMFNGCKFANVDLVQYRKKDSLREKDIKDVKLIDIYKEYSMYFDDKKVLQQEIENELKRRKIKKGKK